MAATVCSLGFAAMSQALHQKATVDGKLSSLSGMNWGIKVLWQKDGQAEAYDDLSSAPLLTNQSELYILQK